MKPPPPGPVEVGSGYRILKGDTLSLNGDRKSGQNINAAVVRPDGKIARTLAGDVTAFGLTCRNCGGPGNSPGPGLAAPSPWPKTG